MVPSPHNHSAGRNGRIRQRKSARSPRLRQRVCNELARWAIEHGYLCETPGGHDLTPEGQRLLDQHPE